MRQARFLAPSSRGPRHVVQPARPFRRRVARRPCPLAPLLHPQTCSRHAYCVWTHRRPPVHLESDVLAHPRDADVPWPTPAAGGDWRMQAKRAAFQAFQANRSSATRLRASPRSSLMTGGPRFLVNRPAGPPFLSFPSRVARRGPVTRPSPSRDNSAMLC